MTCDSYFGFVASYNVDKTTSATYTVFNSLISDAKLVIIDPYTVVFKEFTNFIFWIFRFLESFKFYFLEYLKNNVVQDHSYTTYKYLCHKYLSVYNLLFDKYAISWTCL